MCRFGITLFIGIPYFIREIIKGKVKYISRYFIGFLILNFSLRGFNLKVIYKSYVLIFCLSPAFFLMF